MDRRGALGVHPNSLRYAAATGTVLIRWEGARQPTVWTVSAPDVDPHDARLELAHRYLHIYGPATPEASLNGQDWLAARRRGVPECTTARRPQPVYD